MKNVETPTTVTNDRDIIPSHITFSEVLKKEMRKYGKK